MHDELLDLVNEYDQVIEQKMRSEVLAQKLHNFRAINGFLINDQNQLWIPRRTAHKRQFPLCLDASVGGYVSAGEHYDQAFERELQEELNINLKNVNYKFLAKLAPHTHKVSAFMQVYIIKTNVTPSYNPEDFIESMWVSANQLQELLRRGEGAKSDLSILVHVLQSHLKI